MLGGHASSFSPPFPTAIIASGFSPLILDCVRPYNVVLLTHLSWHREGKSGSLEHGLYHGASSGIATKGALCAQVKEDAPYKSNSNKACHPTRVVLYELEVYGSWLSSLLPC